MTQDATDDMTEPPTDTPAETRAETREAFQGQTLYTIHELSRLVSVVYDDDVAPYGLTRARWWTLMHVAENEGHSQSHIAGELGMGRAAAGRQLAKMEELGLIERRADPHDSRARTVYLTPQGEALRQPMEEAGYTLCARLFAGFAPGEEAVLFDLLDRLKANATAALKGLEDAQDMAG